MTKNVRAQLNITLSSGTVVVATDFVASGEATRIPRANVVKADVFRVRARAFLRAAFGLLIHRHVLVKVAFPATSAFYSSIIRTSLLLGRNASKKFRMLL